METLNNVDFRSKSIHHRIIFSVNMRRYLMGEERVTCFSAKIVLVHRGATELVGTVGCSFQACLPFECRNISCVFYTLFCLLVSRTNFTHAICVIINENTKMLQHKSFLPDSSGRSCKQCELYGHFSCSSHISFS